MSALSLTGRTVNDPEVFDAQTAVVGRFGDLVATGTAYNMHLGANGTYVIHPPDLGPAVGSGRYAIRFRDRPELRVDSTRLIDTGPIDADHAYAAGVEFAANRRNWLLQSEYTWFGASRRASTLDNPRFSGYYIEGSWLITGESHRYNPATASYHAPRPFIPFDGQGGWGAWELALRYSHTDLDYHAGLAGAAPPADGIRGGVQSIATAGVNWYPNPNLRFTLELLHFSVDRLNPAGMGATPFGPAPATPRHPSAARSVRISTPTLSGRNTSIEAQRTRAGVFDTSNRCILSNNSAVPVSALRRNSGDHDRQHFLRIAEYRCADEH